MTNTHIYSIIRKYCPHYIEIENSPTNLTYIVKHNKTIFELEIFSINENIIKKLFYEIHKKENTLNNSGMSLFGLPILIDNNLQDSTFYLTMNQQTALDLQADMLNVPFNGGLSANPKVVELIQLAQYLKERGINFDPPTTP